jgi:lysyl-tRNA synthetase class 1
MKEKLQDIEREVGEEYWPEIIAEKIIQLYPDRKEFICASGATPSGKVHLGNLRDVITSDLVCRALRKKGFKAQLIFSWDEFDRLRKIPPNVSASFSKYLGMPLVEVPDPFQCHSSYAKHFESEFEGALFQLGIRPRFIYQAEEYQNNRYYHGIKKALQNREKIARILGNFRTQGITEEEIKEYYPLQIYCKNCRRSTTTKIIAYDGEDIIKYSCECGHSEAVDISKENVGKLGWKIDWAMRWKYENVNFEPGGADHAITGGSYDVAKEIAREIFSIQPPLFQGYAFVGFQGVAKMSSSRGTGITLRDALEIYEPEILRWIFCKKRPEDSITLSFDSEVIRMYEEFDRMVEEYHQGKLTSPERRIIEFSSVSASKAPQKKELSFRQVAAFGQIVQGNLEELKRMYERLGIEVDEGLLRSRLEKSQAWIDEFMPELKIRLRNNPNKDYFENLSLEEQEQIERLARELDSYWTIEKLTWLLYEIPKQSFYTNEEVKKEQRRFFKNVYQMLIDSDTGPRLPTFLMALGKEKVKELLNVKS